MRMAQHVAAWAKSGGAEPTARDYVQRGLYHRYDAIENGGYDIHDTSLNYAVDLAGNNNATYNQSPVLNDKWWRFENTSNSVRNALIVPMDWSRIDAAFTIGCVFAWHEPFVKENVISGTEGGISLFAPCKVFSNGEIQSWANVKGSKVVVGGNIPKDTFCSYCCTSDGTTMKTYLNGRLTNSLIYTGDHVYYRNYLVVSGDPYAPVEYPCNSSVSNMFVYDVELSQSEIAANYAIDKVRFGLT